MIKIKNGGFNMKSKFIMNPKRTEVSFVVEVRFKDEDCFFERKTFNSLEDCLKFICDNKFTSSLYDLLIQQIATAYL